jgi:hypothetical protein
LIEEAVERHAIVREGRPAEAGVLAHLRPETAFEALALEAGVVDHRDDLLATVGLVQ